MHDSVELLKQLRLKYRRVFGTEEGSEVLNSLRDHCNVDRCAFVRGATNQDDLVFVEGQREVFRFIQSMMGSEFDEMVSRMAPENDDGF